MRNKTQHLSWFAGFHFPTGCCSRSFNPTYIYVFSQSDTSWLGAKHLPKEKIDKLIKLFNSQTLQQGVNFNEAFKFQLLPQTSHNQSLIIEPADSHQVIYPQFASARKLKLNLVRTYAQVTENQTTEDAEDTEE
ncbi:MAG: hypothetical protein RM347_018400 [Nostoc sp. ChiQUE02]|uniref:hypothetical protein n=1 Tax=Nostoc sp. ChiQUE02 TaxID=3075377 RepID=UPI002AD2B896|nr:hypothetical protein [Nostoc sp. ChiQUE02]MDZ8230663.1 hypothetical protein [Nostoc sp. ChiQUE02]